MLFWMRERSLLWQGEGVVKIKSPYGDQGPFFVRLDWRFISISPSVQIAQSVFLEGVETKSLWSMILEKESYMKVYLTGEERPLMRGEGFFSLTEAMWTLQEVEQKEIIGQEKHWRDDRDNGYFEAYYGSSDHRTEVQGVWRARSSAL